MNLDQNNFLITEKKEIVRIDKLLADKFKAKPRTYFQYLLGIYIDAPGDYRSFKLL